MRLTETDDVRPGKYSGLDIGWRVHGALIDYTGKADSKAGFALSVELAALATAVALSSKDRVFGQLGLSWTAGLFYGGILLMICAVGFAVAAVGPRLHSRQTERHWRTNFIYFGHLRFWEPADLTRALQEADPLPVLCRQLVDLSRILWIKHRRVQLSLWLAFTSGAALLLAGLLS